MATIKSYTDLQQSKKLAEFLPLESADGFWEYYDKWCSEGDEWEGYEDYPRAEPYLEYTRKENEWKEDKSDVPCWGLAALRDLLPSAIKSNKYSYLFESHNTFDDSWVYRYYNEDDTSYLYCKNTNEVDACYEIILKLHRMNLL